MYSEINFSTAAEPRLFLTTLSSFVKEQQMAHYGAIIICRSGKANIQVNFDDWQLFEGAVITIFPNDVIRLMPDETEEPFLVEMLQYDAAMLREASLQLEHRLRTTAPRPLPPRLSRRHRHHKQYVPPAARLLRPSGLHLHLATCIATAQGLLHRFPRILAAQSAHYKKQWRVATYARNVQPLHDACGARLQTVARRGLLRLADEHHTQIPHSHCAPNDPRDSQAHHRPLHHPATQAPAYCQSPKRKGNSMGIPLQRRVILLPLLQTSYGINSDGNKNCRQRMKK